MFPIATVVKPQGIKGEVKLWLEIDSQDIFQNLSEVFIGGARYALENIRLSQKEAYVKIKGIDDRDTAEFLRGKRVEISDEHAPKLAEGRYYITDLIGCTVVDDGGKTFGKLVDILQYGAADVYVIAAEDGKEISFPALKKVLANVDLVQKLVTVYGEEFQKVAVYED